MTSEERPKKKGKNTLFSYFVPKQSDTVQEDLAPSSSPPLPVNVPSPIPSSANEVERDP
ncbi:hypothetical protein LINPERPRIM_LOCUS5230, partial [Linum perenne]